MRVPPLLDQFSFQWTNTGRACAPTPSSPTPCVPFHGRPSDCQGISQVFIQLNTNLLSSVV